MARVARRPFAASHSNARGVCAHPRNLTDDEFRAIVDAGGIVGINYYRAFISNRVKGHEAPADGEVTFDELAAHVEHFLDLGGEGTIALGSDFDGSETPDWLDACEKVAQTSPIACSLIMRTNSSCVTRMPREWTRQTATSSTWLQSACA